MGERLENKSFTIDVLGLEVQRLDDQIAEMRTTVDYATRILAGCWLRDYEMWRTLAGIREERRTRGPGGLLRRLTGRKSKIADGVLSPVQRGQQQQLSKRELDAVMVMAEQNVRILHEDVDEMDERVGGMKSALGGFPVVEVEEGSWRDI
ncbi:hypothetical protein CC86DRAFT_366602 [Ophiobolus disseminans]|uniref:Uncharacterized protein n=1 Tax=Ophiobolus disseminans TaxID=1469910 RepID=A0A6A7ACY1_9PLEO|nr:hypothetical protein CC86DRAFT_366602 [Ophiobolus disseminans]